MLFKSGIRYLAIVILVLLFSSTMTLAGNHRYVEDFLTSQYKDTLNATAWWDTVSGELKLFPFELKLVGSYGTPGESVDLAISGDRAFIADGGSGLTVVDISDPTNPMLAGSYHLLSQAWGVYVSGDHAFVADGSWGLRVLDISNPANPTLVGTYDTPERANSVYVSGDHAFVADAYSGLQVIDISDPTNPTLAGSYDTPIYALGVAVSGDHAFVADAGSGVQVIDISDPTNPTLAGSYDTPGYAGSIAVSGDHIYVADDNPGLLVLDISDPANPTFAGSCDTPGRAWDITVSGDYAFVADYGHGLTVVDISDPSTPTVARSYDALSMTHNVVISGEHAFVADEDSGLQVIDISDPVPPVLAGSYNTLGDGWGLAVSGNHAFLADDDEGLVVIDISNPTTPTLTGAYNTPGLAYGVAVSGNHAFVADKSEGLQVIDISDPANPSLAGAYNTSGSADDIDVSGNFAFVADGIPGLKVIDVSDPANPALVGTYNTSGTAYGVAVSGNHAFVADMSAGLKVIDISDPAAPTLEGSYDTSGLAWGVAVSGDLAFMADMSAGLQVIDISDPANPALLGTYNTPGEGRDVTVSGDYVFVADGGAGIQVIDISDPTTPTLYGGLNTSGWALDIIVEGDNAFMASGGSGLQVIPVFQRKIDPDNNVGWSLAVDTSADAILSARLTTTQLDPVTWELSADGGLSWQGITPDGNWNQMTIPGTDLMWRSTLVWTTPGDNPSVSQLEIDWLGESASIDSIVDVPGDQGGWVRIYFTRSNYDFASEDSIPIATYDVHRRVDNPALVADIFEQGERIAEGKYELVLPDGSKNTFSTVSKKPGKLIRLEDRYYIVNAGAAAPPGVWEIVGSASARQQEQYVALASTVADSTDSLTYSVYFVAAHTTTPSIYFDSPPDSGYSVDNIAPSVPEGFMAAYNTGSGNTITWDPVPDNDLQYYKIYRDTEDGFTPSPDNLIDMTTTTTWNDPEYDGWQVYYKVSAVDHSGNEGDAAGSEPATAVANEPRIPTRFALHQNVPNPFNPTTVIRYDVPASGGHVTLKIYDVAGRLVQTLVDRQQTPGEKTLYWNGTNEQGHSVASGVYFYRMTTTGFEQTRKMVLLR